MEQKKSNRGGKREGAGRKTKVDEEKANVIMLKALSEIKSTDTDDDTKIAFLKDLYKSERGKMFIAEHIFGKPKEHLTVDDISDNKPPSIVFQKKASE